MLTEEQFNEIREHLQEAQNPVFFYDSDADGLSSFVLLAKWLGKGYGVVIKDFRDMWEHYLNKAEQLGADCIFCLDLPYLNKEFVDAVNEKNLKLVSIDHHDTEKLKGLEFEYNTFHESGKNESVAELCYEVTQQKKDMWIAVVGCVADVKMPSFFEEFAKENPEWIDCEYETAFDVRYKCRLGKLIDVFNFGLKDTTTNVVRLQKFLIKAQFPSEVLEENPKTKTFLDKYDFLNKIIKKLVVKAEKKIDIEKKLLFFTYGGTTGVSQHLSDRLMYRNPGITIVLGYNSGGEKIKFSLRGNPVNVREVVLKAIEGLEGAGGGGHKFSSGAQICMSDLDLFRERVENLV